MLKTLRNRLILSHALPLLIIVPLMGILLIYVLETQYLIPNLTQNLIGDAKLIANLARDRNEVWTNPVDARALLAQLDPSQAEWIMLINPGGELVASTGSAERASPGVELNKQELELALSGQVIANRKFSPALKGEVIDILVPVLESPDLVSGIVRINYRIDTFYEEFLRLRYLIAGILFLGLLIGISLGFLLALNIERPISTVTEAVYDLASGKRNAPLPEKGPEEIRQLQRAANHLVERLHLLEQDRHKLLANLVHELGRPLGALRAAIQALRRGAAGDLELSNELLAGMDEETIRLQHLTEDLAELHDQVLGTLELHCEPISLSEWLPRVLRPWEESAREHGIEWQTDIPQDLPVILGDQDRLAQAVGNLVSNAIKYTPAGGVITVQAGSEGMEEWVQVRDTGPGIAPEEQENIFKPFYRGSQGRRFPQGMGLGLSIVHDLISAHKGTIEVESASERGSQFTIRLPRYPSQ